MNDKRTAVDAENAMVATMGEALGRAFHALYKEVVWVHAKMAGVSGSVWNGFRTYLALESKRRILFQDCSGCAMGRRSAARREANRSPSFRRAKQSNRADAAAAHSRCKVAGYNGATTRDLLGKGDVRPGASKQAARTPGPVACYRACRCAIERHQPGSRRRDARVASRSFEQHRRLLQRYNRDLRSLCCALWSEQAS